MSDALQTKINEMFGKLMKDGYEGNQDAVRALVDEARRALIRADGTLPPWETAELEKAARAVAGGRLRLALFGARHAFDVSQLPPDEYAYGFNYTKRPRP